MSAEFDQQRALEVTRVSGGSGALFCDYVCLGRYLLSVYEACPFRGDRLVHLCAAMVEAVAFLIRDMRYACGDSYGVPLGAYDDDGSLVALLNGEWPLCTVAIRGMFEDTLRCMQMDASVAVLQVELDMRRRMFEDLQWYPVMDGIERTAGFTRVNAAAREEDLSGEYDVGDRERDRADADDWEFFQRHPLLPEGYDTPQMGGGDYSAGCEDDGGDFGGEGY